MTSMQYLIVQDYNIKIIIIIQTNSLILSLIWY